MAKETTSTSTELTVKSLEDSGIKTSINQSDLIDIVVQDKHDRIQREVERIDTVARATAKKFSDYLDGVKNTFLEEVQKVDPSITLEQISMNQKNRYSSTPINGVFFSEDQHARVDNIYQIGKTNRGNLPTETEPALYSLECNVTISKETEVAKGIKATSVTKVHYIKEVKLPAKTMASFYSHAKALNIECDAFIATFPSTRINMNKVTKDIKTKMNKAILKNQAPALQEQMKKVFDIDL